MGTHWPTTQLGGWMMDLLLVDLSFHVRFVPFVRALFDRNLIRLRLHFLVLKLILKPVAR